MNSIPQGQNRPEQLDRLAARWQLFRYAKRLLAVQLVVSVPVVVIFSFLTLAFPKLKPYAAVWGGAVTLLDLLVMDLFQKKWRRETAELMEMVDCELFGLEWNPLKSGSKPSPEMIGALAESARKRKPNHEGFRDWYPTCVGRLPLFQARLICQRASCWWDANLRRKYSDLVLGLVLMAAFCILVCGLWGGLTVENLVLGVAAPLLPALTFGLRQWREHRETATAQDKLRAHIEAAWRRSLSPGVNQEASTREARQVQDELFDYRRRSIPIFGWVYDYFRDAYERQMNRGAESYVREALGED